MLVATCLLATSLFTCEWHRPGTAPRLQPKPIEVASLPPIGFGEAIDQNTDFTPPVRERFGSVQPHPERFGRTKAKTERLGKLAYAALPLAVYGDYAIETAKEGGEPEKRRADKARREKDTDVAALPGVTELKTKNSKVRKTRAVVSRDEVAYAAPSERGQGWLASLFKQAEGEEGDAPNTSKKVAALDGTGYDAVKDAARRYGPGGRKFEKLAQDITYTESRGRCGSVSSANALGVMQTKLGTAKMMGYKGSAQGLKNCRTGAEYGVKYLAYCHDLADGDIRLTSVCYNQGHGVLTNPKKYGKLAKRKEAVNYVATMKSRGWRM